MRSSFAVAALTAIVATTVSAQTGFGRFPCTLVNGDGSFSADQSKCTASRMVAPGTGDGNDSGNQGDGVTPVDSVCVKEVKSGAYFCGIAGAACTTAANCDNGVCKNGVCNGGFNQGCGTKDSNCLGYLYCTNSNQAATKGRTCGGVGAYCTDYTQGSTSFTDAQNSAIFNQFCNTGYCNTQTAQCDTKKFLGQSCASDTQFGCGKGLKCSSKKVCVAAATTSQRARRSLQRRDRCPASHTACSVSGSSSAFECIDTSSNLEQCGACASAGGVDCTAIEGAESVGCVGGVCEIWACASGYTWDASSASCKATL